MRQVDQMSQLHINTLVSVGEDIKLSEVSAWADASRQKELESVKMRGDGESGSESFRGREKLDLNVEDDPIARGL